LPISLVLALVSSNSTTTIPARNGRFHFRPQEASTP
jgi:hypothetical protein